MTSNARVSGPARFTKVLLGFTARRGGRAACWLGIGIALGGVPAPAAWGQTPTDPSLAGCVGGVLVDPKAYFFALIGRTEGSPAPDWQAVLNASGIPTAPSAGVKPDPNLNSGITQQRNSAGEVRGRLFLPTDIPDDFGYYLHPIDVVKDDGNGGLVWAWSDWIGGPPYAPQSCPTASGTPITAGTTTSPGGTSTTTSPTSTTSAPSSGGCVGGVLVDPKAYFLELIGRTEGSSAADWQAVMNASGIPTAPPAGVKPNPNLNSGITQQRDSAGNVRGRLFLPTDIPDDFGYYLHPIDVLKDNGNGGLVWAWSDWIGGPPYAPQSCPTASGTPITAGTTTSPGGTSTTTSPTSTTSSSSSGSGTTTPTSPQYTSGGNSLATYQAAAGSGSGGGGGGGGCWTGTRGGAGAIPALVAGLAVLGLALRSRKHCARRQP